jgi:hypothetical protein
MQQESEVNPTKGQAPTHRLWIVEDKEGADPVWTELAALWPNKKRTGFTGRVKQSQVFPAGFRLVILPAKGRKDGGAA